MGWIVLLQKLIFFSQIEVSEKISKNFHNRNTAVIEFILSKLNKLEF